MAAAARSVRLCRRLALSWLLAGAWTVPSAVAQTIFSDAFETGRVCRWSIAQPFVVCASYQTCARPRARPGGASRCPTSERRPRRTSPGTGRRRGANAPTSTSSSTARATCPPRAARSATIWPPSATTSHIAPPRDRERRASCYPDLWMGAGVINFAGTTPSFQNVLDLQPNPSFASVPSSEPAGCCNETALLPTWAAATGQGSATSGCTAGAFAARTSCASSPAVGAGYASFGYPCFRSGGVAMIVLPMSEDPTGILQCPFERDPDRRRRRRWGPHPRPARQRRAAQREHPARAARERHGGRRPAER